MYFLTSSNRGKVGISRVIKELTDYFCLEVANRCLTETFMWLLIQERAGLETTLDIITYWFKLFLLSLLFIWSDKLTMSLLLPLWLFLSLFIFYKKSPPEYFKNLRARGLCAPLAEIPTHFCTSESEVLTVQGWLTWWNVSGQ